MSLTIKPGYDFEADEVPTQDKFLRAARGVEVSGIDLSFLDATLIAHKFTTASGVTLPSEGWLWTDGAGNTWVQTANGAVRWGRNEGGWESRRWAYVHSTTANQGNKGDFTGGAEEGTAALNPDTARVEDGGVYSFVLHDTAVSGAHPIFVGRGGSLLSIAVDTQYIWPIKTIIRTYGATGLDWAAPLDHASDGDRKVRCGSVLGHAFGHALGYQWFYGRSMWGPGATL